MDSGAQLEFVADRLRGEIARFDITDKDGKVVVEMDKRITARHVRSLEQTGTTFISVPEDYVVGRNLAGVGLPLGQRNQQVADPVQA